MAFSAWLRLHNVGRNRQHSANRTAVHPFVNWLVSCLISSAFELPEVGCSVSTAHFYIEPLQRLTFDLRDLGEQPYPGPRQPEAMKSTVEAKLKDIRFLLINCSV